LSDPTFDSFSASIASGDMTIDQSSNGLFTVGSRTVTLSGGKTPYSYNWMLTMLNQGTAASIFISSGSDTATVTVKAFSTAADFVSPREYRYARLTCFVSDANGRLTAVSVGVEVGFAADVVVGE
jgi:hypothetical protein